MPDDARLISAIEPSKPSLPVAPTRASRRKPAKKRPARSRRTKDDKPKLALHDAIEMGRELALPFISPSGGTWWSVRPTGEHFADREIGREYALAYLDYAIARRMYRGHPGRGFCAIMTGMLRAQRGRRHDLDDIAWSFLEEIVDIAVSASTHERIAARRHTAAAEDWPTFERGMQELLGKLNTPAPVGAP